MAEAVVLGIDFGISEIAVGLCDLSGQRLADAVVHPVAAQGARWNLELGIAAGQHLLRRDAGRLRLVAIGAATFGVPGEHRIEFAEAIAEWGDLALASELRRGFGCPAVAVLGDLAAAAGAEARQGALRGCDSALYVRVGDDVAIAPILGGRVVTGANGAAGAISAAARTDRRDLAEIAERPGASRPASAACAEIAWRLEAVSAARHAPARLEQAVEEFSETLAFQLVNLSLSLDPERIALGGELASWWLRIEATLSHALKSCVPHPPELVPAAFPRDGALIGALAAGLEQVPPNTR